MLPDLSVFLVIALGHALSAIRNSMGFGAVVEVGVRRPQAVSSARTLAERAAEEARRAGSEFERQTQEARVGLHRQMDEMRRAAIEERTALVGETRREADQALTEARAALAADVARARGSLDAEAESLAADVTSRILGRRQSRDQSSPS